MEESVHDHDRTALVLYGSETGNAQDVAEELGRLTERLRFATKVAELDSININELLQYSVVIFSISTTGQGDLPRNTQNFWKKLRSTRLALGCLSNLLFASFGLGDSSYPKYNWAHRKLHNRLTQLGANAICEKGESDEQHPEGIDGCFLPWATKLRTTLLDIFALPVALPPIPDDEFLTPPWGIELREDLNGDKLSVDGRDHWSAAARGERAEPNGYTKVLAPEVPVRETAGFFTSTLLKNDRLTPQDHWQDVRLFEFSCPRLDYLPGDVLTIYPHNSSRDVNELLELMEWEAFADMSIEFVATQDPSFSRFYPTKPFSSTSGKSTFTLRELLTNHLDITAIPRRSFFSSIAHFTCDEVQRERLLEFTDPQYIDELYDYTTRPRRSILEVLQEFHTVKLPYKWAASILPHTRGRQFSIASGGSKKYSSDGTGRIELLVAIVKYKTVLKKIREGLCTKYLASLDIGTKLEVQFVKGGMKPDLSRTAIMVGPGTGVAPLRAMVHEDAWRGAMSTFSRSENLLFFGGRNRHADYFFETEWRNLSFITGLEVFPAFSRDQKQKIYVQDLIREQSRSVYKALQNGIVYICGSSGKMPQAVREALIDVFEKEGATDRSRAEQLLIRMEKEGRYQQETW